MKLLVLGCESSRPSLTGAHTSGGACGPNGSAQTQKRRHVPASDDPEFLVTLPTLCKTLNLPLKWARRKAWAGELPCVRIGSRLHFSPEAVKQWLLGHADRNQYGDCPQRITTPIPSQVNDQQDDDDDDDWDSGDDDDEAEE